MLLPKKPFLAMRIGVSIPFLWCFCRWTEFSRLRSVAGRPLFRWCFKAREADLDQGVAYTQYILSRWPLRLLKQKCLLRSLALYSILKPFRPVQLVFGVRKGQSSGQWDGHCWLEIEGKPFLDTREGVSSFERICVHA